MACKHLIGYVCFINHNALIKGISQLKSWWALIIVYGRLRAVITFPISLINVSLGWLNNKFHLIKCKITESQTWFSHQNTSLIFIWCVFAKYGDKINRNHLIQSFYTNPGINSCKQH